VYFEKVDSLHSLIHLINGLIHRLYEVLNIAAVEWSDKGPANGKQDFACNLVL